MPSAEFVQMLQDQVAIVQDRCRKLEAENLQLRSDNQRLRDTVVMEVLHKSKKA